MPDTAHDEPDDTPDDGIVDDVRPCMASKTCDCTGYVSHGDAILLMPTCRICGHSIFHHVMDEDTLPSDGHGQRPYADVFD